MQVTPPTKRILRLKEVQDRTGLSKSTIYSRINPKSSLYDSGFPKQIKLGSSACASVGWLEESLNEWIALRCTTHC
jgi:prophage regulatory protein